MSNYTSEIVVGSAVVAALGVAAYWVTRPTPAQPDESLPSTTQKRQPKKKKSALQDPLRDKPLPPSPAPRIPKAAPSIPGAFAPLDNDELSAASGSNAGTAKKKKKKPVKKATENSATATPLGRPVLAGTAAAPTRQQHLSPEYPAQEPKTDEGPWTRVESRRKTSTSAPGSASDAGVTTSATEEEGSITEKQEGPAEEKLTLAERLLPRPAETAVDECAHTSRIIALVIADLLACSMLEGPKPGIARVLRVTQTYDRPSGTAEWGDYEDAEDVRGADLDTDDGWSVVPEKAKRTSLARRNGICAKPLSDQEQLVRGVQVMQALPLSLWQLQKQLQVPSPSQKMLKRMPKRRTLPRLLKLRTMWHSKQLLRNTEGSRRLKGSQNNSKPSRSKAVGCPQA